MVSASLATDETLAGLYAQYLRETPARRPNHERLTFEEWLAVARMLRTVA